MKVFFVSGVDTDIGKTFATKKLIASLQDKGKKALAIKPIETGLELQDSLLHLQDAQKISPHFVLQDINYYSFPLPCAPYVADSEGLIDLGLIFEKIAMLQKEVEILLIEGAGGLFVPIKKDYFMTSLACELQKRFQSKVIMVCDDKLGMINRFLSAKFILDSLKLHHLFFVNIRDMQTFQTINLPFLKDFSFEMQIESLVEKILKGEQ